MLIYWKVFLTRSAARVITSDPLRTPNPACGVCSVMQSWVDVDLERATLNDLVQDVLKKELGYGEEFSINNEVGILYDPDLEDNLAKRFSDLGVKADSFLTVIDDDEEDPRLNLSILINQKLVSCRSQFAGYMTDHFRTVPDSKPLILSRRPEIVRKPAVIETTNSSMNGNGAANGTVGKRKRSVSPDTDSYDIQPSSKRGKLEKGTDADDLIVVDDSSNGAIVIDD